MNSTKQYNFQYYKTPPKLKYYTNVVFVKGKLLIRGIDEQGQRRTFYSDYQPSVCVPLYFNFTNYKPNIIDVNATEWKNFVDNEPLVKLQFDSIYNCSKFVKENTKISKNQFGQTVRDTVVHTPPTNMFVSQYIGENFPGDCHIDSTNLRVLTYDIETEVGHRNVPDDSVVTIRNPKTNETRTMPIIVFEDLYEVDKWDVFDESINQFVSYYDHPYRFLGNFPDPLVADERITLITVKDLSTGLINTWGLENFVNKRPDVTYRQFNDEYSLLKDFVEFIEADYPDILIGYNSAIFDNAYVATRVKNVCGEQMMERLSPCRVVEYKQVDRRDLGTTVTEVNWIGISNIDYLKLYKKFTYGKRESYKLDSVAEDEVGIKKVPNPTGGTFVAFYSGRFRVTDKPKQDDDIIKKLGVVRDKLREKAQTDQHAFEQFDKLNRKIIKMCKQRFIEYNIRDVELIDKIDAKQRFVDLLMTIAYLAHCNYENVFSPVQTWDYTIYNKLLETKRVIPIKKGGQKSEKFPGAYVKSPLLGKHDYCESFDLDSLYPHIIMQYNIGPETLIRDKLGNPVVYKVDLESLINKTQDMSFAHEHDYAVASSGVCFSRDHQGLLSTLCEEMYANRKSVKKEMLWNKNEHEKVVNELRKRGLWDK